MTRFTSAFLAVAFFAATFFAATFFAATFFGAAFFAATFFGAAFFATDFFAGVFPAGALLTAPDREPAGALLDPPSSFRFAASVARPGDLRAVAGAPPRAAPDAFPRDAVDERPEPGVVLPSLERFFATPALPRSGVLFRGIFGRKVTRGIPAVNMWDHIPEESVSNAGA
ncbi:MAG TPA: hypothetical protein VGE02_04840 [Gemmatimonadales bacterium]